METVLRFFAFPLALCGVALFVVASAAAVPKPPPKYWSPARCERAMEHRPLAPPGQVVCVGTGGPAEVPLDERQAGAPVLGVHGVHAAWVRLRRGSRRPQRRCSLLHARHTRPPRLPQDRLPLGRPIRRVAGGLLQAPRRGARNQCDSSGVSLHRRADLGSPRATRKRDRLHAQIARDGSILSAPANAGRTPGTLADPRWGSILERDVPSGPRCC